MPTSFDLLITGGHLATMAGADAVRGDARRCDCGGRRTHRVRRSAPGTCPATRARYASSMRRDAGSRRVSSTVTPISSTPAIAPMNSRRASRARPMPTSPAPAAASTRPCMRCGGHGRLARRAKPAASRRTRRRGRDDRRDQVGLRARHRERVQLLARRATPCRRVRRRRAHDTARRARRPAEFAERPTTTSISSAARRSPAAAGAGLADAVDAFCETIGFTPAETRRVFEAARAHGTSGEAARRSAVGHGRRRARRGIRRALRRSPRIRQRWRHRRNGHAGTVAVLLPGAFYALCARRAFRPSPRFARMACRWRLRPIATRERRPYVAAPDAEHGVHALRIDAGGGARGRHAARGARARLPTAARSRPASAPTSCCGTSGRRPSLRIGSAATRARASCARARRELARTMNLADHRRGDAPLVIDIPHAGTLRAAGHRATTDAGRTALPDTDWHVDKLFASRAMPARPLVATTIRATSSISIAIHPVSRSIPVPTTPSSARRARSAKRPIYADGDASRTPTRWRRGAPDTSIRITRRLPAEIERVRVRHGHAVLLDGHSIRAKCRASSRVDCPISISAPPTARAVRRRCAAAAASCSPDPGLHEVVERSLQGRPRDAALWRDPRAACTRCSSKWRRPATWTRAPPFPWNATRAAPLVEVLQRLVAALVDWRTE